MRRLSLLLLPFLATVLTGCPLEEEYPPDQPGKKPVDPALLGTWNIVVNKEHMLNKIRISRGTATNSYLVEILETGVGYSVDEKNFTTYITQIDNHNFVYTSLYMGDRGHKYYVYCYKVSNNKLHLWDLALEQDATVTDTQSFRAAISTQLKKKDGLFNEAVYVKEE